MWEHTLNNKLPSPMFKFHASHFGSSGYVKKMALPLNALVPQPNSEARVNGLYVTLMEAQVIHEIRLPKSYSKKVLSPKPKAGIVNGTLQELSLFPYIIPPN